jgi:hypothetical protein
MHPKILLMKFMKSRKVIEEQFGKAWLESGTENILQKVWNRTDWIAYTELLIFGDCLEKCSQFDKLRTEYYVKKIKKSANTNEQRGDIFEMLIAGAYYNSGSSKVFFPENPRQAGYDLMLITGDKFNIYISIKNYGNFGKSEDFVNKAKEIKELVKENIHNGCNSVCVFNESLPDVLGWRSLRENLPGLINSDSKTEDGRWAISLDGGWDVMVRYATRSDLYLPRDTPGRICPVGSSYILLIQARIAENDLEVIDEYNSGTLFGKIFDDACYNLEVHGNNDPKSINIIFLKVPREINLESIKQRCISYFKVNETSKLSGILLYQPEFAADINNRESLAHFFELITNPSKGEIVDSKMAELIPKFITGKWIKGSAPIMLDRGTVGGVISNDIDLMYQSGHIYCHSVNDKCFHGQINGILFEPCIHSNSNINRRIQMQALLPENKDLILL